MASPLQIHGDLLQALQAIAALNGRVHDGYVPDKVESDAAGYVLPYLVLFAGTGDFPGEDLADGTIDSDSLIFDFQTTSVGPTSQHAAGVDVEVVGALLNLRVGTGRVKPNPDGFNQQVPIRDTNITPARFMLPRQWRLYTN